MSGWPGGEAPARGSAMDEPKTGEPLWRQQMLPQKAAAGPSRLFRQLPAIERRPD